MKNIFCNHYHDHEPVWHLQVTVLLAISMQVLLPARYIFGSRFVTILLELLLLLALSFTTPRTKLFQSLRRRMNVFLLLGLMGLANLYSLIEVAKNLLQSGKVNNGKALILTAVNIYLTNIIVFAILYYEMDSGGPGVRASEPQYLQDFVFPQNQNRHLKHPLWFPTFIDYLYVSSTNAMAFSPTDTMPLTHRAKLLMLVQATISLVAIALVAARAVNILN